MGTDHEEWLGQKVAKQWYLDWLKMQPSKNYKEKSDQEQEEEEEQEQEDDDDE